MQTVAYSQVVKAYYAGVLSSRSHRAERSHCFFRDRTDETDRIRDDAMLLAGTLPVSAPRATCSGPIGDFHARAFVTPAAGTFMQRDTECHSRTSRVSR